MKTKEKLISEKMMTLVRSKSQEEGEALAQALVDAGVKVIEITLTTPGALKIIKKLVKNKGLLVGAGTVRSVKDVKKVAEVGASFIVSPDTNEDVIGATKRLKLVSMPGVLTPSEVGIALDSGADIYIKEDEFGYTTLDLAKQEGYTDIIKLLQHHHLTDLGF